VEPCFWPQTWWKNITAVTTAPMWRPASSSCPRKSAAARQRACRRGSQRIYVDHRHVQQHPPDQDRAASMPSYDSAFPRGKRVLLGGPQRAVQQVQIPIDEFFREGDETCARQPLQQRGKGQREKGRRALDRAFLARLGGEAILSCEKRESGIISNNVKQCRDGGPPARGGRLTVKREDLPI
jgi:hypothetical protein